jgi:translation initiation factor IF-1
MKREIIKCVLVWAALFTILIWVYSYCWQAGLCEETIQQAWVICQPDSYVNIRERASGRSGVLGRFESGTPILTDGEEKNGFTHLVGLPLEEEEGWIHSGYIVYGEPEEKNAHYRIRSNGRVAARRSIDGKRRRWMRNGDRVTVYRASKVWAVTNQGFIQTKYLEEEEEQ